jgi:glutathione S-transferase
MKLYFAPGACSLASHIVLEESGAKYETQRVNLREGEQRKPEYLRVNWKGKVPALAVDDTQVLTENPVIMQWVADEHAPGKLLAPTGDLKRARALEWLAWCASGIQPQFGPLFRAAAFADSPEGQELVQKKARATLTQLFETFASKIQGEFVLGQFSIADAYTLVFANWAKGFQIPIGDAHRASARALIARPAVARVLEQEGLKLEL